MTTILETAFAEAAKLPPADQELFAAWILAELDAEQHWKELFSSSSTTLDALADEALREFHAGQTQPLDPEEL